MPHPIRNIIKSLLLAVFVLASIASFGVATAAAKSKPPCWKTLINDWYDGRIDGTYPIQCYRDALKHLPADVETYSSAREDIKQALQKRITQGNKGGGTTTTSGGSNSSGGGGTNTGGGSNGGGPQTSPGGKSTKGPFGNAFDKTGGKNADSVPLPLIILAAIAFLLMVAGAAGFLARRTRTRRLQLAAAAAAKPPRQTP